MADELSTSRRIVYGVPLGVALRGVGVGTVGLGACVIGAVLLAKFWPSRAIGVALGLLVGLGAVLSLVVLGAGVLRVMGRGARLVIDEDGFLNATGPATGVRRAAWRDVRKVQADGRFVSVDIAGGRRSLIRTGPLDVGTKELALQLRARLNRSHGYRPLSPPE